MCFYCIIYLKYIIFVFQIFYMKSYIIFVCLLIFSFGCKKSPDENLYNGLYQKKVLVEEFTGEWCGSCPSGAKDLAEIISSYPDNAICIGMHINDKLEVEFPKTASFLASKKNIQYIPSALVNRQIDPAREWIVQVNSQLDYTSDLGLKIETDVNGDYLDIKVSYTSENNYDNIFLSLYIVEDYVPETSPGAQVNGGGNYVHRNVLREILTSLFGNPVNITAGQVSSSEFNDISISKYKLNDLKVVAIMSYGADDNYNVINTNYVNAGNDVDW